MIEMQLGRRRQRAIGGSGLIQRPGMLAGIDDLRDGAAEKPPRSSSV